MVLDITFTKVNPNKCMPPASTKKSTAWCININGRVKVRNQLNPIIFMVGLIPISYPPRGGTVLVQNGLKKAISTQAAACIPKES